MTRINISVYIAIIINCTTLPASTATAISSATTKETTEDIFERALNDRQEAIIPEISLDTTFMIYLEP